MKALGKGFIKSKAWSKRRSFSEVKKTMKQILCNSNASAQLKGKLDINLPNIYSRRRVVSNLNFYALQSEIKLYKWTFSVTSELYCIVFKMS